jgi:hypothetical protein
VSVNQLALRVLDALAAPSAIEAAAILFHRNDEMRQSFRSVKNCDAGELNTSLNMAARHWLGDDEQPPFHKPEPWCSTTVPKDPLKRFVGEQQVLNPSLGPLANREFAFSMSTANASLESHTDRALNTDCHFKPARVPSTQPYTGLYCNGGSNAAGPVLAEYNQGGVRRKVAGTASVWPLTPKFGHSFGQGYITAEAVGVGGEKNLQREEAARKAPKAGYVPFLPILPRATETKSLKVGPHFHYVNADRPVTHFKRQQTGQ